MDLRVTFREDPIWVFYTFGHGLPMRQVIGQVLKFSIFSFFRYICHSMRPVSFFSLHRNPQTLYNGRIITTQLKYTLRFKRLFDLELVIIAAITAGRADSGLCSSPVMHPRDLSLEVQEAL